MSVDIESHLYRADSWLKRARDSSDHLDGQFIFCWIALNALYGQRENESGPPRDRQDLHIFLGRIAGCEAAAALALHKGRHFWSNATDALRIGLFGVLDGLLRSQLRTLNGRSKTAADDDFRDRKFFFVHSCKVRPVPATLTAPPDAVIASCARRHLVEEIVALGPRAVCFLGHNTLPAAGILGLAIDDRQSLPS